MTARLILAVLLSAAAAPAGGFASKALGLHHFWPGVIGSFVIFVPIWLVVLRRTS